jgi:molybdopterin-guanine dinucleotide biosynthesis protein A
MKIANNGDVILLGGPLKLTDHVALRQFDTPVGGYYNGELRAFGAGANMFVVGDTTYLCANCYCDGVNWQRIDTAKAAYRATKAAPAPMTATWQQRLQQTARKTLAQRLTGTASPDAGNPPSPH